MAHEKGYGYLLSIRVEDKTLADTVEYEILQIILPSTDDEVCILLQMLIIQVLFNQPKCRIRDWESVIDNGFDLTAYPYGKLLIIN